MGLIQNRLDNWLVLGIFLRSERRAVDNEAMSTVPPRVLLQTLWAEPSYWSSNGKPTRSPVLRLSLSSRN